MKPLLLAGCFAAGLVAADRAAASGRLALAAGLVAVALVWCAWLLHRRLPAPVEGEILPLVGVLPALALAAGIVGLGFADLGVRQAAQRASPLPLLDGRVVDLAGRLATDPQPAGRSWVFTLASVHDASGNLQPGRLAVRQYGNAPDLMAGDRVLVEVKVEALDLSDPFDARQAKRGISAAARLVSPARLVAPSPNPLIGAANFFRERMSEGARAVLPANRAALLLGLTIGDDRALSDRVVEDFRASGLSHLTAVSGANVAMVLAALAWSLQRLRASRRLQVGLGLGAVLFFAVITRWEPSVLRASVMAGAALAAFLFGRPYGSANVLGVALLGLLMLDPTMLWSIGFQLSFAATAGIVLMRAPLASRLSLLPRVVAEPVAIGLAAQMAVFPVVAIQFQKLSIASLPANLVAAPLVAPGTVLGLAAGVVALVSIRLAAPLFAVAGICARALEWTARTFGRSDLSQLNLPHFKGWELVASLLGLLAAGMWLGRRERWARWPVAAGAIVAVWALVAPAAGAAPPAGLRVTLFDVGQGDSALVESPDGARVLIDGGPDPELIASTLRRRGTGRLDVVVATHMHADHIAGLEKVLERFEVSLVLEPGVETPLTAAAPELQRAQVVRDGERLTVGDLRIEVLGPGPETLSNAEIAAVPGESTEGTVLNDASVVLRVDWAGQCVLFTGDLEEAGQQELLDRHRGRIDCTVMKAPHHGSGRVLAGFAEAVDPEWVAISVGRNDYGHPAPRALEIYEEVGARVMRTDREGDVVLEIDGAGRVRRG